MVVRSVVSWRRRASTIWRSTALRLFIMAFVVYNANLRAISSADTFPARYLPISILTEFNLDLDEFPFLLKAGHPFPGGGNSGLPYFLQRRRGHLMSAYPVMPAILATPVYALPVLMGLQGDSRAPSRDGGFTRTEIVGTMLAKLAASLVISLSVALIYLGLTRLTSRSGALWITLGYAFATSSWSVSSQGLWQTTMSQALFAGSLVAFYRARNGQAAQWLALAGGLLGLAVACRPPAIILAVFMALYAAHAHREHFLRAFLPPAVIIAVLLLSYNVYFFGGPYAGYGAYATYTFTVPHMAPALYGLLVSPNRGMLVFSPVLVAGFAGLGVSLVRRDALLGCVAVATLLTIVFYSSISQWDGGFSYSYRFLVDLLPGLAFGAAVIWEWIQSRRWRRAAMAGLFVLSVGVQIVGAFDYPCGWYRSTLTDPALISRTFDWTDLEIVQCLRRGPVEPDGVHFLRQLRNH